MARFRFLDPGLLLGRELGPFERSELRNDVAFAFRLIDTARAYASFDDGVFQFVQLGEYDAKHEPCEVMGRRQTVPQVPGANRQCDPESHISKAPSLLSKTHK